MNLNYKALYEATNKIFQERCDIIRHLYTHAGCPGDRCPLLSAEQVKSLRASVCDDEDRELGPMGGGIPYAEKVQ
jgi:hypothetical protein